MAAEVSPEGDEVPGAVTDGTAGDGAGSLSGQGVEGGPTAVAGMQAGADSGSRGVLDGQEGSGRMRERGVGSPADVDADTDVDVDAGTLAGAGAAAVRQGAWDDIVLDEDFIRDAETAEPSARARMLAARWREQAPDPQPWRSDEPPAGWFFSKARRRRWRKR